MPIKKAEHKENFTQILNEVLSNDKLSYGARGLMAYVLTHCDNWVFTGEDYFTNEKDKLSKVKGYLKELIKFGYLKRYQEKSTSGVFGKMIYIFFEIPKVKNPTTENRITDKASLDSDVSPKVKNPITVEPTTESRITDKTGLKSQLSPKTDLPITDSPLTVPPLAENRILNNTNINNTNIYSANDVESIWSLYPNKKGKSIAIKKIPNLLNKYGKDQIGKCITRYSNEIDGKDKQYILNGSTFFNGRYEDYLDCNYKEIEQTVQARSIIEEDYIQT